jgi:hypothetical protein
MTCSRFALVEKITKKNETVFPFIIQRTFDAQTKSVEHGSNRSSRMVVVPELIVLSVLAVRDHLSTCLGTSTLHVQYQPTQSAHYDVVRNFFSL